MLYIRFLQLCQRVNETTKAFIHLLTNLRGREICLEECLGVEEIQVLGKYLISPFVASSPSRHRVWLQQCRQLYTQFEQRYRFLRILLKGVQSSRQAGELVCQCGTQYRQQTLVLQTGYPSYLYLDTKYYLGVANRYTKARMQYCYSRVREPRNVQTRSSSDTRDLRLYRTSSNSSYSNSIYAVYIIGTIFSRLIVALIKGIVLIVSDYLQLLKTSQTILINRNIISLITIVRTQS